MDRDPTDDLAARVAAWHNRHPLARRVTPADVRAVGLVVLPFRGPDTPAAGEASAPADEPPADAGDAGHSTLPVDLGDPAVAIDAGSSDASAAPAEGDIAADPPDATALPAAKRRRWPRLSLRLPQVPALRLPAWLRRGRASGSGAEAPSGVPAAWQPAFDEAVLPPLGVAAIARFAQRHGSLERPGDGQWPVREVIARSGEAPADPVYLRTAAIEVRGHRVRVLIGRGDAPAVVGARLWSAWRVGAGSALASAAIAGAGVALVTGATAPESGVEIASAPAAAASVTVAAAAVAASAASAGEAVMPAMAAASAAASPASASASAPDTALAMADAASSPGAGASSPDIRPLLSAEERAAARAEAARLRGELVPALHTQAAPSTATETRYALVTRRTRGRPASEIVQSLMVSAAAGTEFPDNPRTEIMAVGDGFRAVWWPFGSRGDAERAQAALAAYGIQAEIVDF